MRNTNAPEPLIIDSSGLRLEGLLSLPVIAGPDVDDDSREKLPGVVLCHPHPRQGGNMQNGVIEGMSARLVAGGFAVLRFNFRGVGGSEGQFAWGSGETDDAEAALEVLSLREEVDASRIGIAGYSFGAAVALQAAMASSMASSVVQAVAAIACPAAQMRAFSGLEILPPKLFALGDSDHDFPEGQFRFLAKRFASPSQIEIVSGADHFFRGFEVVVGDMAVDFFREWLRR